MNLHEAFNQIKQEWMTKTSEKLSTVEGVRKNILELLEEFFGLFEKAVDEKNPQCMDPLLSDWAKGGTETELRSTESFLAPVINTIFIETFELFKVSFSTDQALELISRSIPVFTHALELVSSEETRMQVEHITRERDQAQMVLEKLGESKSDFISVAAHELKTPLTLIEGYVSMYQDVLPENESKKALAELYLKGLHAGTRRLREIVDDMIDVSMIDNNLLALNYQPIWINHLFELVRREIKDSVTQRRIQLVINSFPGINELIFADGERLYQALRNVVMNGVKFTPDGGKITIDGRLLPGFVEVTVSDTGIGIDPEDHLRIFEKFGRLGDVSLHSSGKTKFKGGGAGLGLPISKGIVDAHGGAIWVESPGYDEVLCPGSTFHIMLPLRKNPPDDKSAKLFHTLVESEKTY